MQTWETDRIPEKWRAAKDSFDEYHDNWTYTLLTDKDRRHFIKKHFPLLLGIYDNFPYNIQRADLIRYCWLYVNGGVYTDLKNVFIRSMNDLFREYPDKALLIGRSANTFGASNYFLASIPHHPFWLACIDDIARRNGHAPWWCIGRHLTVMYTTGPLLINRTVKAMQLEGALLPIEFQPCNICVKDCFKLKPQGAYIVPLEGQSWNDKDSIIYNWLYCNWKEFIVFVILGYMFLKSLNT